MANLPNLDAEVGADYIADDAQPGVAFRNTGTGPGLRVYGLVSTSAASIDLGFIPTIRAPTATAVALELDRAVEGNSTVAILQLNLGSTASGPIFELGEQGFVSCTTILFTTGATAGVGAIRVKHGDNYKWIPVLPDGSVTAGARG